MCRLLYISHNASTTARLSTRDETKHRERLDVDGASSTTLLAELIPKSNGSILLGEEVTVQNYALGKLR